MTGLALKIENNIFISNIAMKYEILNENIRKKCLKVWKMVKNQIVFILMQRALLTLAKKFIELYKKQMLRKQNLRFKKK